MAEENKYEQALFACIMDKCREKERAPARNGKAEVLQPIATELNNVAVDLSSCGVVNGGMQMFREALHTMSAISRCHVREGRCVEVAKLMEKIEWGKKTVRDNTSRKQCVELDMFEMPTSLQVSPAWIPDMMKIDSNIENNTRDAATVLFNLGLAHMEQEGYVSAAYLFETVKDALMDSINSNGFLALVLNSMGCLYYKKNDFEKSCRFFYQAYSTASKELQASANNCELQKYQSNISLNLGRVFLLRKNYTEASLHCFNALQSKRSSLGDKHIEVCVTMYNLGLIMHLQGRYDKALDCYWFFLDRAFATSFQNTIPNKHKVTVLIQVLMIQCKRLNFSYKSFELSVLLKKLRSLRYNIGCNGPFITQILNSIGIFLLDFCLSHYAVPFFIEQLQIEKVFLGQDNPTLATTHNNIGQAYQKQHKYHQALTYFQQAFTLLKSNHSNNSDYHSLYAVTMYNIGINQYQTGSHDQSLTNLQKAIQHQKLALGEYHPDIADMLANVGSIQLELGKANNAMNTFMEALLVRRLHYGNSNILTAELLYKIAKIHELQGNYQEALDVYSEKLRVVKLFQEQNTLDVVVALHDIAQL